MDNYNSTIQYSTVQARQYLDHLHHKEQGEGEGDHDEEERADGDEHCTETSSLFTPCSIKYHYSTVQYSTVQYKHHVVTLSVGFLPATILFCDILSDRNLAKQETIRICHTETRMECFQGKQNSKI